MAYASGTDAASRTRGFDARSPFLAETGSWLSHRAGHSSLRGGYIEGFRRSYPAVRYHIGPSHSSWSHNDHGVITIIEYSCQIMDTNLQRVIRTMLAQDLALDALWGVSCLWNTIVHRCDVVERKRLTREPYASQLLSIFNRCIRSICASTANRERETVDFFSRQAWKILEDFPHLMNPRLSPQLWAKRHETAGLDDYRMIEAILSSVSAQRCASPECTRTFSDRWPFRWCAGCRRVTYCSRRCQKTAWAHEVVGHRSICSGLRRLGLKFSLANVGSSRRLASGSAVCSRCCRVVRCCE
jgi:hypothetical protein